MELAVLLLQGSRSFFLSFPCVVLLGVCKRDNAVFSSLESFHASLEDPKTSYILYDYFLKYGVGCSKWADKVKSKTDDEMSHVMWEAFAHTILENNYFSWLLEFRAKDKSGSPVVTEYQLEADWTPQDTNNLFDGLVGQPKDSLFVMNEDGPEMGFVVKGRGDITDDQFKQEQEKEDARRLGLVDQARQGANIDWYNKVDEIDTSQKTEIEKLAISKRLKKWTTVGQAGDDGDDLRSEPPRKKQRGLYQPDAWGSVDATNFMLDMAQILNGYKTSGKRVKWFRMYKRFVKEATVLKDDGDSDDDGGVNEKLYRSNLKFAHEMFNHDSD